MANKKEYTIATLGSHSALQILKGAKDEGFKTIAVCEKGKTKPYEQFRVADEIVVIDSAKNFSRASEYLRKKNSIIIPHASFIAYMGADNVEKLENLYFGNRRILEWESDREKQRQWMKMAGIKVPRVYRNPKEIDKSVIVKFHGALGGAGYFLAKNYKDFKKKIRGHRDEPYVIQEYIMGVPVYIHYFYSPLKNEVEIMSFDKRYESNVDSLGRISARDQMALENVDPSYVIVGNLPLVIRESFLPEVLDMGERVVEVSKRISPPGLVGPFCLETIFTPKKEIYVFEISARIVAGTNPYIQGSPYTQLRYKEPMSTGRRIAREIKDAIKQKKLSMVLT